MIALSHSCHRAVRFLFLAGIFAFSVSAATAQSSRDAEQAGATLFRDKGCAYCHGASTQGTAKGPSLLHVRKALKAPQMVAQIKNGGQKMPSFEDSLSADEINQLVAYLRAKHRPAAAPSLPPKPESTAPAGTPASTPAGPTSSPMSNPGQ